MALNIIETVDVSSTGDDPVEGFTAVNNNWEALSTELLPGYKRRSVFGWVTGGTTMTVGGGIYEVNGTLARITSELTTTAHGLTANGVYIYLYIDYSAIPSNGVIDNTDFIWSLTGPTWSHTKLGWYNGNDRCIFAGYAVSNLLVEFENDGQYIHFGDEISILSAAAIATSFTDVTALKMPPCSTRAKVNVLWLYVDAYESLSWRTNGSASTTGTTITDLAAGATQNEVTCDVITDSSGVIEMMESGASTNTCTMNQLGYYLPEGM